MGYDITISEARQAYIDHYYRGKRVDEGLIRYIENRYATDIKGWKAAYESKDSTQYDISDSEDAQKANEKGGKDIRKSAKYNSDEKAEQAKNVATSTSLSATSAAFSGAAAGVVAGAKGGAAATVTLGGNTINGIKVAENTIHIASGTERAAGSATGKALFVIGCVLALATGAAYELMRPNKKEVEALVQMGLFMEQTQENIVASQEEMEQTAAEIESQVQNAEDRNEQLRAGIEAEVSNHEKNRTMFEIYNNKIASGIGLTREEALNYTILADQQEKTAKNITGMEGTAQTDIGKIYDKIGENQSKYDDVALNLANSIGQVEEVSSIDKTIKTSCQVEAAMQSLNVVSGAISGAQAIFYAATSMGFGLWSLAFAAMAFAGAGMSAHGMAEQIGFIGDINTEMDIKNDLDDINTETSDMYDEHLAEFDASLGFVDNIVHEVPTDASMIEAAPELNPTIVQNDNSNPFLFSANKKPQENV